MVSEFGDNIDRLLAETPEKVSGHVVVDQVYAHYQHEHPELHHPDGGGPFYLTEPLFLKADRYLAHIAEHAVDSHGVNVVDAMSDNMEDLSREVYDRAPWEFGDLRASGHPIVEADGEVVYDRAPHVHRLSKEELRIKSHLRYLFDPHRYDR